MGRGDLAAVVATTPLELAMDLPGFRCCLLLGYPGTVADLWQAAGRVGRAGAESLTVFLGHDTPVNRYLMRHPEWLFARRPEPARVDPWNPYVVSGHLAAAAQ